jgi:hypothetical protein
VDETWTRVAEVVKAKRPFGLLCWGQDWSCESFARFVKNGLPHSEQAEAAKKVLAGAAILGLVVALVKSGTSSSFDANAGRFRDRRGRYTSA